MGSQESYEDNSRIVEIVASPKSILSYAVGSAKGSFFIALLDEDPTLLEPLVLHWKRKGAFVENLSTSSGTEGYRYLIPRTVYHIKMEKALWEISKDIVLWVAVAMSLVPSLAGVSAVTSTATIAKGLLSNMTKLEYSVELPLYKALVKIKREKYQNKPKFADVEEICEEIHSQGLNVTLLDIEKRLQLMKSKGIIEEKAPGQWSVVW